MLGFGEIESNQVEAVKREHAEALEDGNQELADRIKAANPDVNFTTE